MVFLQTYGDIGMCVNHLLCACCIGVFNYLLSKADFAYKLEVPYF